MSNTWKSECGEKRPVMRPRPHYVLKSTKLTLVEACIGVEHKEYVVTATRAAMPIKIRHLT